MRIEKFREAAAASGGFRVEADVVWEERDRKPLTVFFEVGAPGPEELDANPFLAAAAIPAFRHGERRIAVEGSVCPRLRDGVEAAAALLGSWYRHRAPAPRIEPSGGFVPPRPPAAPRAALFLSGGVDSLYSLWWNRRNVPRGHPRSFRTALRVRDLMYPVDASPARRSHIELRSARAVASIARAADLEILEVRTDAFRLEPDFEIFATWTHGSVLAACALAAGAPLTDVTISASHDVRTSLKPWGSHPLLDPLFGTAALAIRHDGIEASRLDKTTAVGRWKEALEALYVCEAGPFAVDSVNCGRCEKCLRTRVALLVGAGIEDPPTFPPAPLTSESVAVMPRLAGFRRLSYYWNELASAARKAGHRELAGAIDRMIRQQQRIEKWMSRQGWRGAVRRLDERFLGSALLRARRRWVSR